MRPTARLAPAHPANVVRDLDQPVVRLLGPLAPLERPVGVQERLLGDVLRVRGTAQNREGVLVDLGDVLAIEALEGSVERFLLAPCPRRELQRQVFTAPARRRPGCLHGWLTTHRQAWIRRPVNKRVTQ